MDTLGKLIWKAACNKAGELPVKVHPKQLISEAICEGEKTVDRRLDDENLWLFKELIGILREFNDKDIFHYLNEKLFHASLKEATK